MDELHVSDPVARRLGCFFADLMVTLAEDGVQGVQAAEAVRVLWQARASVGGTAGLEMDVETVVHGLAAVAAALADEVVATRRATGSPDVSLADVWLELVCALDQKGPGAAGSLSGGVDLPS